jgi:autotransporter-associated beta strand protein
LVVDTAAPAMIEASIANKATIAVGLADNPANAAVGLQKTGSGALYLNGESSYRGDTLIQSGTVVVGADATATTGPLGAPNGGIVILSGGMLVGDGAMSRDTGKVIQAAPGFSRLGSDTTAIKVSDSTIQSGATLETRGGVETGQMSVQGTWLLSGTDPVSVAQMNAASGALLIWNKPMASTAIVVTSPGAIPTDLRSAQVAVSGSVAQSAQNFKGGTVVGTLVQSSGTLVSSNSVVQPAGRVRFRLDLHPAVGAAPGVIELVVDLNEYERDGGRAFAGLSALWSRRGTAMDEPLVARLNTLAATPSLQPAIGMGVRMRSIDSKAVREPEKIRSSEDWGVDDRGVEVWVAGYGVRNHFSEDAGRGFGAAQSSEGGGALGIERRVDDARGGVVFVVGQGDGRVRDPSLEVDSDYWGVGGYGSIRIGAVTLDSSAMWGRNDQESTRETAGGAAKAKFSSGELHAGVGMTLNLTTVGRPWQVAPVARLQYVNIAQGAFEEKGGSFPVAFDKIKNDRLLSKVGFRVGRHGPVSAGIDLGVDGAAYWVHDYTSNGKTIPYRVGASSFSVAGRNLVTDSAMFDLGVQATFGNKLTLGVSGRQQVGGDQYQTSGLFSVGVRF